MPTPTAVLIELNTAIIQPTAATPGAIPKPRTYLLRIPVRAGGIHIHCHIPRRTETWWRTVSPTGYYIWIQDKVANTVDTKRAPDHHTPPTRSRKRTRQGSQSLPGNWTRDPAKRSPVSVRPAHPHTPGQQPWSESNGAISSTRPKLARSSGWGDASHRCE